MKSSLLLLPVVCMLFSLSGCAKSPSGGPSTGRILNRLESTLTVRNTIDQTAYYAVAFDDVAGDGIGPGGIEGNTSVLNGIVGGNFRLAVVFHLNQFEVYYRSDPADPATEQRVLTSTDSIFAATPRATSNGIDFTLNLDARLNSTTYFFPRTIDATPVLNLDRIDLNFVTSNVVIRDGNDNRIKPVDANGFQTISSSNAITNFQTNATRNSNLSDPSDDARPYDASFSGFNFGSIDVTSLQINLTRSSG